MTDTQRHDDSVSPVWLASAGAYQAGWREAVGAAASYSTHLSLTAAFQEGYRRGDHDLRVMAEAAAAFADAATGEKR